MRPGQTEAVHPGLKSVTADARPLEGHTVLGWTLNIVQTNIVMFKDLLALPLRKNIKVRMKKKTGFGSLRF